MRDPVLIDSLVHTMSRDNDTPPPMSLIDGGWAISKPIQLTDLPAIAERVYHAWLVLIGKAEAYQYVEDRVGKKVTHA